MANKYNKDAKITVGNKNIVRKEIWSIDDKTKNMLDNLETKDMLRYIKHIKDSIEMGVCSRCASIVTDDTFIYPTHEDEYKISGLCPTCQMEVL